MSLARKQSELEKNKLLSVSLLTNRWRETIPILECLVPIILEAVRIPGKLRPVSPSYLRVFTNRHRSTISERHAERTPIHTLGDGYAYWNISQRKTKIS